MKKIEEASINTMKDYPRTGMEIAVIGMAGRFPGAKNIPEFWDNLKNGMESISFFSNRELEESGADPELINNPHFVKAKGVLEGSEYFDMAFFGYTPVEAKLMDPQVRIFHEYAWEALENAGYNPETYKGKIGVYAGASSNFNWQVLSILSREANSIGSFSVSHWINKDCLTTHLSFKLNLSGPSFVLHTACSTSLVAIHLACQGILSGECSMALAGGVSVTVPLKTGYLYSEGMVLSPDGHCRAFDAETKGFCAGNGVGIAVLKLLERAIADRDYIHAVIKGSAVNNDGNQRAGYTAPGIKGQVQVIKSALRMAEVDPESIGYIETHGTGTPLGDPIEIESLTQAFNTKKRRFCKIGSVKTNIGHLDAAAGVAGFIKTILALKHRQIPPSLHFRTPNPKIDFEKNPFRVNTELTPWENGKYPLRAGVSSFGIGGTNAHVVLEEWPQDHFTSARIEESSEYRLILLSARKKIILDKITENLANYIKEAPGINLADAAYTLQMGRKALRYRKALVCSTAAEVIETFTQNPKRIKTSRVETEKPPVIFVFDGQGSQYVNMGLDLYQKEPDFREELDRCLEILKSLMDNDIKEILYPAAPDKEIMKSAVNVEKINQTEISHPLVFAFEYALAKLLMKWGIHPQAMIGYSLGEYAAACISGVFSLEDALKLVTLRSQLITETPAGAMLSVPLPEEEIKPLLNEDISLAIVNGPSCVAAGSFESIEAFTRQMKEKRIFCTPVNGFHAIHSRLMCSIREKFEHQAAAITLSEPRIPYISNISGEWITVEQAAAPGYWGEHLCSTVRFSEGIGRLLKQDNAVFVEIGAGRVLSTMIRQHPAKKNSQKVLNLVKHQPEQVSDERYLLSKIGELWLYGVEINWPGFYAKKNRCRVPLPNYPFEKKRFMIDEQLFKKLVIQLSRIWQDLIPESSSETEPEYDDDQSFEIDVDEEREDYIAPRDELERKITRIWQELLGFEKIGIYDNFFHLNGDSLTATRLIARIQEIYPVELQVKDFFEEPTVDGLAKTVKKVLAEKIKALSAEEKKKMAGR